MIRAMNGTGTGTSGGQPTCSGGCGTYVGQMAMAGPLHSGLGGQSPLLVAVLGIAGVGAALLLGLAIGAFVRRQSRPYLLIAGAIAALFGRSVVAGLTVTGVFAQVDHHFVEHGLDVVLVALVIAAVYQARTGTQETDFDS